jgi:transcriptional regulator with XRE-family HTH domain
MKKRETNGIVVVPHKERPASLEVQITGIPQWKQDVFNLVAELTKYRLRNKITQKELANRLHVNQSVIARFEKLGRYPTIEFLYKVAEGLGVQVRLSTSFIEAPVAAEESKSTKSEVSSYAWYYHDSEACNPNLKITNHPVQPLTDWWIGTPQSAVNFADDVVILEIVNKNEVETHVRPFSVFNASHSVTLSLDKYTPPIVESSFQKYTAEPDIPINDPNDLAA